MSDTTETPAAQLDSQVEEAKPTKKTTNFNKKPYSEDVERLAAIFERRKAELGGKATDADAWRSFIAALEAELSDQPMPEFGAYTVAVNDHLAGIRSQLLGIQDACNARVTSIEDACQRRIADKDELLDTRKKKIEKLESDLQASRAEVAELQKLPETLAEKDKLIDAINGQIKALEASKNAEIDRLNSIIKDHGSIAGQLAEANNANTQLQEQVSNLSAAIADKEKEIAVEEAELKAANNSINDLKERLKAADERAAETAKAAVDRVKKAEEDAQRRIEAAEEREKAAKEEGVRREEAVREEADRRVEAAKDEADKHAEQVAAKVAEAHSAEIERLKAEQAVALQEVEAQLNEARSAVAELTAQLETLKTPKSRVGK